MTRGSTILSTWSVLASIKDTAEIAARDLPQIHGKLGIYSNEINIDINEIWPKTHPIVPSTVFLDPEK